MQPESSLTLEEIAKARRYKADGLSTQQIMARIARERLGGGQMRMSETQPTQQTGVLGRVLRDIPSDIKETAQNVRETSQRFGERREAIPTADASRASRGVAALVSPFAQTTAMAGDVVMGAAKTFTTPEFEKKVSGTVEEAATPVMNKYSEFTQNLSPQAKFQLENIIQPEAGFLMDVGLPSSGAALSRTVGEGVSRVAETTTKDIARSVPTRPPSIVQTGITSEAKSAIVDAYNRSVKPNFNKLTTPQKQIAYQSDVNTSMASIVANKANLQFVDDVTGEVVTNRLPQTLKEYTEAIDQTKRSIFDEYNTIAEQAGEAGAFVDNVRVANSLNEIINSKRLSVSSPETIRYAIELKDTLLKNPKLSVLDAQDIITDFNNQLASFYSKASPEAFSQTAVKALVANTMRQAIDDSIGALDGTLYQTIKSEYGALKNIERDVMRAYLRDSRKNVKGLVDFTDILSGGQVVSGILSFNPASIAQGFAQKAIAEGIKMVNDPNRAVKKMFEQMERYAPPVREGRMPTRKALPSPKEGALRSEVSSGAPITAGGMTPSGRVEPGITERATAGAIKQPSQTGQIKQQASRFKSAETFKKAIESNPAWKAKIEAAGITPDEVAKMVFGGGAAAAVIILMLDDENISPLQFGIMGAISATPAARKVFTDKLAKTIKESEASEMRAFIKAVKDGEIKAGGENVKFASLEAEDLFDSVMTKVSNMPVISNASMKQITDVFEDVLKKRKDFNKGATPSTNLLEEAKGKTLEEFVEAQQKGLLFHGTGEVVDKLKPVSDDVGILWTANKMDVAESYIPDARNKIMVNLSEFKRKGDQPFFSDTQGVPSWVFGEKGKQIGVQVEEIGGVKATKQSADEIIKLLESKGIYDEKSSSFIIGAADKVPAGKLYQLKLKPGERLKIKDLRRDYGLFGEEMADTDRLEDFLKAKQEGYDGVRILDFNHADSGETILHESFGLFEAGLKKVDQTESAMTTTELKKIWEEANQ